MTLKELQQIALDFWSFDAEQYPAFGRLAEADKKIFILKHMVMHEVKVSGKMTELMEDIDHEDSLDQAALKKLVRKQLLNTMYLAGALGIPLEELEKELRETKRD